MRTTIARICLALALGTLAHVAQAAKLAIVGMEVPPTGVQCGLDKATFEGRTKVALRASGITVVEMDALPNNLLYVDVSILKLPNNLCVGNLNVEIVAMKVALPRTDTDFAPAKDHLGRYIVCDAGYLMSRFIPNFASEFLNTLESEIKNCLGKTDYK